MPRTPTTKEDGETAASNMHVAANGAPKTTSVDMILCGQRSIDLCKGDGPFSPRITVLCAAPQTTRCAETTARRIQRHRTKAHVAARGGRTVQTKTRNGDQEQDPLHFHSLLAWPAKKWSLESNSDGKGVEPQGSSTSSFEPTNKTGLLNENCSDRI